jgi:alkylhydroperoxidase family enzyme
MTRIDYPDLDRLSDSTKTLIEGRPLINVLKMWAHSEPLMPLIAQLGATQFAALELSPRHRELLVLALADAIEAPYVWNQHEVISESCGVTQRDRDAIRLGSPRSRPDAPFDAADCAMLDFARAVADGPTVPTAVFAAVSGLFSPRQIVEAVSVLGYYFTIARMTTVLEIESDEPGHDSVLEAGIELAGGY